MGFRLKIYVCIWAVVVFWCAVVESKDCRDVVTSEGARTLRHGQRSCASLGGNEDKSDLGRKFVTCSSGRVFIQECQVGLRYDTSTGMCNWPQLSTCQIRNDLPEDKSLPIISSNKSTTTETVRTTISPTQQSPRPIPAGPCNTSNCKMPKCFCFGGIPSIIPTKDTPMFVMLTFDDAVTSSLYDSYFGDLVVNNHYRLFNPNGCRIKSAFFVSHENTDYTKVTAIWDAGNEIGSHTIHHQLPEGDKASDYREMVAEIQGLKDEMLKATGNATLVDSIVGFRAPYLRVAGDVQFNVLQDFHFRYDTSILNINILQGKKPHWPYTLDHLVGECINPPCPGKPYPGLWEVPLNGWIGDDKQGCSMVDACVVGASAWTASEEEWYRFYGRNFRDYFYPTKVPMPIFTHGSLFANYPNSYMAMTKWLQDVLRSHNDVWFVTPAQVIDWMKTPVSNKEMIDKKWGC